MTLEDAQKRVEELLTENKKLKNRVAFLEKAMYDDVVDNYRGYDDEDNDYEDAYERYSD